MPLLQLPPSLQQCVLLEWLSPETVWTLVRLSGVLRRCVQTSPQAFRAADKEVLSDACVRWFQERGTQLVLFKETRVVYEIWTEHLCNGKRHRDGDLPARIGTDGSQQWYQHGKLHRDGDLPANVWASGTQEWYQTGERHRDGDRPACVEANGTQGWFRHGKLHRDGDQPAIVYANSTQEWWQNGERHREDGLPRVVYPDGTHD